MKLLAALALLAMTASGCQLTVGAGYDGMVDLNLSERESD